MMELVRLALALTGATAAPPPRRSLVRTAAVAALAGLSAVATMAALACAAAGLWIWVRPLAGPAGAAAIVAAAFVVLAIMAMVAARLAAQGRPAAVAAPSPAHPTASSDLLFTEAAKLVTTHKIPVLLGALLVGAIAGMREK
jgi:hypothetical protein